MEETASAGTVHMAWRPVCAEPEGAALGRRVETEPTHAKAAVQDRDVHVLALVTMRPPKGATTTSSRGTPRPETRTATPQVRCRACIRTAGRTRRTAERLARCLAGEARSRPTRGRPGRRRASWRPARAAAVARREQRKACEVQTEALEVETPEKLKASTRTRHSSEATQATVTALHQVETTGSPLQTSTMKMTTTMMMKMMTATQESTLTVPDETASEP
jgi:hypothetical protein